jgi:hypothetical protein
VVKAGGGVVTSQIGVDGILGEHWIITQPPSEQQPGEIRALRVYVVHEGNIVLVQALAEPNTFVTLLPAFETMLTTLRVPKSPNANAPGDDTPKRVDLVRTDAVAVPLFEGFTIKPVDPRVWLTSNGSQGAITRVERRTVPEGGLFRPSLSVVLQAAEAGKTLADLQKDVRAQVEAKPGVTIAVAEATLDGKTGEAWDWTEPLEGRTEKVRNRRIAVLDGTIYSAVQMTADEKGFEAVKADFETIAAGVKLPKPAAPQAAAAAPAAQ